MRKRGGQPVPVRIRGVTYPSQTAAAEALGVNQSTIAGALDRGTIDRVGCGAGSNSAKPVTLHGVSFPSYRAANQALGRGPTYVQDTLRSGGPIAQERLRVLVEGYREKTDE